MFLQGPAAHRADDKKCWQEYYDEDAQQVNRFWQYQNFQRALEVVAPPVARLVMQRLYSHWKITPVILKLHVTAVR